MNVSWYNEVSIISQASTLLPLDTQRLSSDKVTGFLQLLITHLLSSGRKSLPPGAKVVSDLSRHATSPSYSEILSPASGPTGLGSPWPHSDAPNVYSYHLCNKAKRF